MYEVKTKDQLLEKIQKFIDSGKPWQWKEKKNVPVICDVCKRTVKKDGYPNKHLKSCSESYPETFAEYLLNGKDTILGEDQHAINMM